MQGRSWMAAAWALATVAALAWWEPTAQAGQDESEAWVTSKVRLVLDITGLGKDGCEVVVKPATPSCKFRTIEQKVTPVRGADGRLIIAPFEVKTLSADRDCMFAITIKEPGHPARTVRRGLRLAAPKDGVTPPVKDLICYLSTPSLAARETAEAESKTRRK